MVSDRRGFGERMKRHRERCGVTLAQISKSSKVPASLFAGLEAGDCSRWPAGLYARAYIRAYAEAVGINPEETVEEFAAAFGKAVNPDGVDATPALSSRAPGGLRLSFGEESPLELAGLGRRTALAAVDLLIGFLIASLAYVALQTNVWVTVGLALSYSTIGRVISDEPLLYWLFRRVRHGAAKPAAIEPSSTEVAPVADTASTIA
jgi:hypothetical protein